MRRAEEDKALYGHLFDDEGPARRRGGGGSGSEGEDGEEADLLESESGSEGEGEGWSEGEEEELAMFGEVRRGRVGRGQGAGGGQGGRGGWGQEESARAAGRAARAAALLAGNPVCAAARPGSGRPRSGAACHGRWPCFSREQPLSKAHAARCVLALPTSQDAYGSEGEELGAGSSGEEEGAGEGSEGSEGEEDGEAAAARHAAMLAAVSGRGGAAAGAKRKGQRREVVVTEAYPESEYNLGERGWRAARRPDPWWAARPPGASAAVCTCGGRCWVGCGLGLWAWAGLG